MNFSGSDSVSGEMPNSMSNSFEDTLRLLARVPVPDRLAERVQAGLKTAPRSGRVLAWPGVQSFNGGWMRAAAAAAIAVVVVGGGWSVYSRVQTGSPARGSVTPPHVFAPGGFSNAGAMRTPQTLDGPVVAQPAVAVPKLAIPAAKAAAPTAQKALHHGRSAAANKSAAQSVAPLAK